MVPLALALAGVWPAGIAAGQESPSQFPSRLIKLIVPYPPGGGVDGLARPIAERLGRLWGQSVIIENKPGAATMIGGAEVAHAPADGHTLLFTSDSTVTSNPHLFKKMLYDPIRELAPVTQLIDLHQFVLVHPSVSANTMKELVALTKEKPDALNYGSYGKGSQPHLLFEMLGKETGAKIQQISYRGIAPAITAVLAGEVQTTLGSVAVAAGHIEARKLKALAIGRQARLPSHPEISNAARSGLPGYRAAVLVRPVRAGRNAVGHCREDSAGGGRGAQRAGVQGALHLPSRA
jgi:tripartite-type tricarboxylate transporter receptor subunit TctC